MEWQRTKQAAESLSLISCDQLRKFVREGFFKEGISKSAQRNQTM
ncbi:hypothetical protein BMF77_01621 [Dolichospermum sp. UHCC 0315A]|nr:hypothetical protein [Dolichospermum sp. UHCC 0315A]QEI41039.1 hypothetical protein BMF77_01621 [Dolichospermum sp. UHCC 0315A]